MLIKHANIILRAQKDIGINPFIRAMTFFKISYFLHSSTQTYPALQFLKLNLTKDGI